MSLNDDIKKYGNENRCYKPYVGAVSYPIHAQDFVRTGFMDVSPTLSARDHCDPKVVIEENAMTKTVKIKQATKQGYIECKVGGIADFSYPESKTRRGRVQDGGEVSPTLTATESDICKIESPYKIRKLTPLEYYRLMNFDTDDYTAAASVNSNSQLYKQAGNSIVVACLCAIFSQLNIQDIKSWNEMSEEQKNDLTRVR